jgi:hypothetical protein
VSGADYIDGKELSMSANADFVVKLLCTPKKITWSIEFDDLEVEHWDSSVNYRYERLQKVQKLVLHGFKRDDPTIFVIDGDANPQPFKGSSRDSDSLFDLLPLRSASRRQKLDLNLTVNGRQITLVSFLPKEKPVRVTNLKDLRGAIDEKGWFSDEEWLEIDLKQQKQGFLLRNANRDGRRR